MVKSNDNNVQSTHLHSVERIRLEHVRFHRSLKVNQKRFEKKEIRDDDQRPLPSRIVPYAVLIIPLGVLSYQQDRLFLFAAPTILSAAWH